MSYILDALRRAESERARGPVPGLEAQALALAGDDEPARRAPSAALWAGGALALGLALAGLWWWGGAPVATAPSIATPVLPTPPAAAPAPAPVAVAAPAVPVAPVLPAVPPPAAAPAAAATPAPSTPAAPVPAPRPSTAPMPAPMPPAVPAAPAARAEPRAVPVAELSQQQRSELPPLAIGGAIYSDSPASRFVLVNGQVVREGEAAAPGVLLERIGPKSVFLRWRELRIEVPF